MSYSFDINMYNSMGSFNSTKSYKELVKQNLTLLLRTYKCELYGDPYFGTNLAKLYHEPNDPIARDLAIDEIYESIVLFMKEITVRRDDISIVSKRDGMDITIKFVYNKDGKNDMFSIPLVSNLEGNI